MPWSQIDPLEGAFSVYCYFNFDAKLAPNLKQNCPR